MYYNYQSNKESQTFPAKKYDMQTAPNDTRKFTSKKYEIANGRIKKQNTIHRYLNILYTLLTAL